MDLSPEQQGALRRLGALTGKPVFLTGRAGTGKSTLMREFKRWLNGQSIPAAVVAPTGLSAVNVEGQTIHSLFQLPPEPLPPESEEITIFHPRQPKWRLFRNLRVLVIDEISMVRVDLLDAIDYSLRRNRRIDEPFGGVQVVMVGDLMQLEPVVREGAAAEMIADLYRSAFFFDSQAVDESGLDLVHLGTVHRQTDEEFLWALDELRKQSDEGFDFLNERAEAGHSERAIRLYTTNAPADSLNIRKLAELPTPERTYKAEVKGDFPDRDAPTSAFLPLRLGARVMFVRNGAEWVNGSLGTVVSMADKAVTVELDTGARVRAEPEKWEKIKFTWTGTRMERQVVGEFHQIPLRLAWALTIHKSQGLTFDEVRVDLSGRIFAHGQLYVALSRCRTSQGLSLSRKLTFEDLGAHERVLHFHRQLGIS